MKNDDFLPRDVVELSESAFVEAIPNYAGMPDGSLAPMVVFYKEIR